MTRVWEKENGKDLGAKILLFLVSPFFSLLYSIRNLNRKSSFGVIFSFCLVFGLAFTVGNERYENSGDGVAYRILFEQYRNTSSYVFLNDLRDYFKFDEGSKDFYADTVSFLVSRITDNYHILFLVYAFVFAFFQLKSLRFFAVACKQRRMSLFILCLLALFIFNQIFNINGVRFWTATWIAVYSVLQVFYNNKNSYLLLAAVTPFVHGSFFLFLLVIVVALLSRYYKLLWSVLFVLSFAFSTVAVDVFNVVLDYLPSFMSNQAAAYLDEWTIAEYNNQVGTGFWIVGKVFNSLEKVYINVLVLVMIVNRHLINDKHADALFAFLLVLVSMANFTMPIPSVGTRFLRVCFPLIALLFVQYMPERRYRVLVYLFPCIFVFSFYYMALNYFEVVGPSFFVRSPLLVLINSL